MEGDTPQTLKNAKKSTDRFLSEASECAERECGFSSMLTAFSVILGISEAAYRDYGIEPLIKWFISKMNNKTSWLILPSTGSSQNENEIGKKLADLRNGLAHEFSMPSDVLLAKNRQSATEERDHYPNKYIISIKEFLDAVSRTVDEVVQSNPEAVLDANPRGVNRATAIRLEEGTESAPLSGSLGRETP